MAKSRKKSRWQESYSSLILGAIVVVIMGLLVANYFNKRNAPEINTGEKTTIEEQQSSKEQEYKTIVGDSLSAISKKTYGSEDFWPQIAKTNNISNPDYIFIDTTLKLPSIIDVRAMKEQSETTSYSVLEGDTLFIIAEKVYGDGSRWTVLDQANNVGRLPNGNPLIFSGSTLVVPR